MITDDFPPHGRNTSVIMKKTGGGPAGAGAGGFGCGQCAGSNRDAAE